MNIDKIPLGKNVPDDVNVIIEIPSKSSPVKYEIDKESGALFVDRYVLTSMYYPCNYGFIPRTFSDDGDPVDVLVVGEFPINPGSVINARPIGVLIMEDESGLDEKILTVPTSKITPLYNNVQTYKDLPECMIDQITNFFENYKKLEKNKWVKLSGWEGPERAKEIIKSAIANYKG